MSRSIGKSAAAAALILGCGVAGLCLPAVADEPPGLPVPELHPLSLGPAEPLRRMKFTRKRVPVPPSLRPQSEKERQILNRIRADWQVRHERIRSLYVAWDFRSGFRKGRNAGPPDNNIEVGHSEVGHIEVGHSEVGHSEVGHSEVGHSELWLDDGFRSRLLVSSRPNAKPRLFTFDGMTARSWNPETQAGEVWNGEPGKGLAPHETVIWCVAVDPLCCKLVDTSSAGIRVLGENAILGDRHCVKLRIPMTSRAEESDLLDTLWIDPARDNVIVGWERGG